MKEHKGYTMKIPYLDIILVAVVLSILGYGDYKDILSEPTNICGVTIKK